MKQTQTTYAQRPTQTVPPVVFKAENPQASAIVGFFDFLRTFCKGVLLLACFIGFLLLVSVFAMSLFSGELV